MFDCYLVALNAGGRQKLAGVDEFVGFGGADFNEDVQTNEPLEDDVVYAKWHQGRRARGTEGPAESDLREIKG